MSDKYTSVEVPGGVGIGLWGHVDPSEAVEELRRHYERELNNAKVALAAADAGTVRVYHQYGPYAARNRRLVSLGED